MRSSMFELAKRRFISDISKHADIISVDNGIGAMAKTESAGDALVEVAMSVAFKAGDFEHSVKVTAYTTTCSFMIQPIGDKVENTSHMNHRAPAKYFAETFLLP